MNIMKLMVAFLFLALATSACTVSDDDDSGGGAGGSDADAGIDSGMDSGSGGTGGTGGTGGEGGGSGTGGTGGTSGEGPDEDAGAVADASDTDAAAESIDDPAPDHTDPGAYACSGCPTSDRTSFNDAAGSVTFKEYTGTVTDADGDGVFYLVSEKGEAIAGAVPIDQSTGSYAVTLPLFCGEQTLKLVWNNASGETVEVIAVVTEGCSDADIRVTATWDAAGDDW
jgi:hypothetical protein